MDRKMMTVGFLGASTVIHMGPASDFCTFFKAVVELLENGEPCSKFPVVDNRLYCGSLLEEELLLAENEMKEIERQFAEIPTKTVDFSKYALDRNHTNLDLFGQTLADVFSRIFAKFYGLVERTFVYKNIFDKYTPIRIGFAELPYNAFDRHRSDEEYNALTYKDTPFWLREPIS